MPMEQSAADQLGEAGQSAVITFFNDLGWGPLATGKHDLGTDLFVQVRDQVDSDKKRSFVDLGMMLGVQVKTGNSWFEERTSQDGKSGWWFREPTKKHEDYWINHHIPHILIIQTEERDVRVWARLDRKSVESTGIGLRVFVPDDNVLDTTAAATWKSLVAEARKLQSFEGSRWTFNISQLPLSEWPRYALLAPRIVAPHPNRGDADPINWAEALALCLLATPERWDHFAAKYAEVPDAEAALQSHEAGWRFAAAVYKWMYGDSTAIEALDRSGFTREMHVAHAICLSIVLADKNDWVGAAEKIQRRRLRQENSVDEAWLAIHHGWILYEMGRIEDARADFGASIAMHAAFPSSLTNSAIRAAGILAQFDAAPGWSGDVEAAVQAADGTLGWWQTQQVESALNTFLTRSFKKWANDRSITFGAGDTTHNNLFSAELTARLLGNRRSSRYATYLRSIANLSMPAGGHAKPEDQLDQLRIAGYADELELAIRHIRDTGPLPVISAYMENVSVAHMTTTSMPSDLASLRAAGSYLADDSAKAWIAYIFDALARPAQTVARFNLTHPNAHKLLEALRGLQIHFERADQERVITFVLGLPDTPDQLYERSLVPMLDDLDNDVVLAAVEDVTKRLSGLPADSWLRGMLTNFIADIDPTAREAVSQRIASGGLGALPSGFRIDSLTEQEAAAVLKICAGSISTYANPNVGVAFGGAPDYYLVPAQVAIYGPESLREKAWELVMTAVAEEGVLQERKTHTLTFLAEHVDSIPADSREPLRSICVALKGVAPSSYAGVGGFAGLRAAGPSFLRLSLELGDEDVDWQRELSGLLTGTSAERCEGIAILSRRPGHQLTLLALTKDNDRDVANAAINATARRAAEDDIVGVQVVPELLRIVDSHGEQAALQVGGGILQADHRGEAIKPLIDALSRHESLRIRVLAPQLSEAVPRSANGGETT